jgi:uncharacterized protein YjbJ (UPF0337 family)
MSGTSDKIKGNVKEGAGSVTGDDKLQAEGQTDQAKGGIKEAAHKAGEKMSDMAQGAKEKITGKD